MRPVSYTHLDVYKRQVTACLVLGQTMPVYAQGTSWIDQVEITAHRGDSLKALENTLPAFEKAIESGSDWIELDVNETKDNVPVVFHDCNLKRIMGKDAKIRDLTLEEIKAVHPADSMGPAFGGIRIPSLEEALNTCKGKISLNIEIKEDGTQSGDFVDRVIQLVRDKKMVDQCMICLLYTSSMVFSPFSNGKDIIQLPTSSGFIFFPFTLTDHPLS